MIGLLTSPSLQAVGAFEQVWGSTLEWENMIRRRYLRVELDKLYEITRFKYLFWYYRRLAW